MTLPEYQRPPVAETVMGVQFRPLPKLQFAHLGAFWSSLGPDWPYVSDVAGLGQTIEPQGVEPSWIEGAAQDMNAESPGARLRAFNSKRDRLFQVENGWFVYNWRKNTPDAEYARYSTLRIEFDALVERFCQFLSERSLGTIEPNLWEIGYINFVVQGPLWKSARDWPRVLPHLLAQDIGADAEHLQTVNGRWVYVLDGGRGRLQVAVEHGRSTGEPRQELLVVRLTARGMLTGPTLGAAGAGLDLGHESIVRKFTELTSKEAREYWGYKS